LSARLAAAFAEFRAALGAMLPELVGELRPPVGYRADFAHHPGAADLLSLWSMTSGQGANTLGVAGGLRLLGPAESRVERERWAGLMTEGSGLQAVARPPWDRSTSLDPDAVRGAYFAAGWIPVLSEPLEANYLAVDLAPLPAGRAGQIVLCGRDEDEKCVVAPHLAALFEALAAECRDGAWTVREGRSGPRVFRYLERRGGRLLTACKLRRFPPPAAESGVRERGSSPLPG
jgi:cell wall assembly regulator SMI1